MRVELANGRGVVKKEKMVTVNSCEGCIREGQSLPLWKCAHCSKEVCDACGKDWRLFGEKPKSSHDSITGYATLTVGVSSTADYSAFICNECSKNEMTTPLLRFGFERRETRSTGSVIPR